jgi:hypothetical protein
MSRKKKKKKPAVIHHIRFTNLQVLAFVDTFTKFVDDFNALSQQDFEDKYNSYLDNEPIIPTEDSVFKYTKYVYKIGDLELLLIRNNDIDFLLPPNFVVAEFPIDRKDLDYNTLFKVALDIRILECFNAFFQANDFKVADLEFSSTHLFDGNYIQFANLRFCLIDGKPSTPILERIQREHGLL